jgi:hypothetical protein
MANRYWILGTGTWSSTNTANWSASSGGAGGASVPTAADNVFFDANSNVLATAFTVTMANTPRVCNDFTASGLDGTMTLAGTNIGLTVSGNLTFQATNFTRTYTGTTTFNATTTGKNITTNGVSFGNAITINGINGSFILQDALTQTSQLALFTLTNGTLDLNGKTLTVGAFRTLTGTKNLTFNGGTLICPFTFTTSFNNGSPTNFTTTAGTGIGTISMTAATAKTFVGGGSTFNCTLNQGGAGVLTITDSNTFSNITNTYKSTGATSILFTAGTTNTFTDWNASGEATRLLTIGSDIAASHTLSKASGTVSADYLSISRSTATGGAGWYAGANSTNGGSNSGWIFTAPPGGGYTIAANNGSYAVTGQTASLLRSKVLSANNGSYTITGQSATLLRSKALSGDYGTYAVTGQSATLLRSKALSGDYGVYTITGQSATLSKSRFLLGDSGTYGVTGQNAVITYGSVTINTDQLLVKLRSFTERRRF